MLIPSLTIYKGLRYVLVLLYNVVRTLHKNNTITYNTNNANAC